MCLNLRAYKKLWQKIIEDDKAGQKLRKYKKVCQKLENVLKCAKT